MPQQTPIDKFFNAVDDAYDVLLDTLKTGVDRGHRVSKGLIEQVHEGQREAIELAQTIVSAPTDLSNATGSVVSTLTRTQGRVLQVSRQWLDEALDAQQEGREQLRRLIDANRQAGEAVIESSQSLFGQARDRARQVIRPGRDGNGAKAVARARRKTPSTNEDKA